MNKYTFPGVLIIVGVLMFVNYSIHKNDAGDYQGYLYIGGILVAIGGIMSVIRSQSK